MINIVATVESLAQAEQLLPYVDTIFFGEERFGLRYACQPAFTREEQKQLVDLAHQHGKKAMIAVNGIMHPEKMKEIPEYLAFLRSINVDVISLWRSWDYLCDAQKSRINRTFLSMMGETLVTSARQINFWAKKGALGAVLAREVPFEEMKVMSQELQVPRRGF